MTAVNMMTSAMSWWDDAPCKGMDNSVFFPEIGKGQSSKNAYDDAIAVCEPCQYRAQCLEFAIESEMNDIRRYGVFGGLTPREREEYFAGRLHLRK